MNALTLLIKGMIAVISSFVSDRVIATVGRPAGIPTGTSEAEDADTPVNPSAEEAEPTVGIPGGGNRAEDAVGVVISGARGMPVAFTLLATLFAPLTGAFAPPRWRLLVFLRGCLGAILL